MRELPGNLWEVPAQARVITTNGYVTIPRPNRPPRAVMGRGVALQACQRWPGVDLELGRLLTQHGNHVITVPVPADLFTPDNPGVLVAFPVKNHWRDRASLELVRRSAGELVQLTDQMGWWEVAMPRPGCGAGHLSWQRTVQPLLAPLLDDRFLVVYNGGG